MKSFYQPIADTEKIHSQQGEFAHLTKPAGRTQPPRGFGDEENLRKNRHYFNDIAEFVTDDAAMLTHVSSIERRLHFGE
jgi:hypothetical protein